MKGSPAKLLAKLNSKPAQFDRAPSGTDGITSLDVAHVLGMIGGPILPLFMRVKWAHDAAAIKPLVDALTLVVEDKARRRKWDVRKPNTIRRMVILALREREVIRPRRHLTIIDSPYECGAEKCRARGCRGVGRRYSRRQGKDIKCEQCDGTGERRWSAAERANNCGLHPSTWPDNWEARYFGLVDTMRAMESKAFRLIRAYTAETSEEMAEIRDGG